jgi:hypothetical protein
MIIHFIRAKNLRLETLVYCPHHRHISAKSVDHNSNNNGCSSLQSFLFNFSETIHIYIIRVMTAHIISSAVTNSTVLPASNIKGSVKETN